MPHVDILFNQFQKRKTEPEQVKTAIDNFENCIVEVRNKIDDIINEAKSICTEPQGNKRRRRKNSSHDHRVAALEVCDNIVNSANDRFQFKDHLVAASLFFPEHFGEYCGTVSVGANESIILAESSTSAISDTLAPSSAKEITTPAKKINMSYLPETEETQKL
ncbi:unnamed protein product [Acanthoscelides obtectus]|uniref:Uncharacterized protein n=1 Tax=Acanthoscelides obtectus TaxID=200917 RepID=A0A9P0Q9K7_ACAOB|nr:unnamed protein product [Acanthoscelides obtectus]CAK1655627.1 hypothetical protein AOBTE_LOCUS19230 [Acanthoscelides obtectus]